MQLQPIFHTELHLPKNKVNYLPTNKVALQHHKMSAGFRHKSMEIMECGCYYIGICGSQFIPHSHITLVLATFGMGVCRHCLDRGEKTALLY